MSKAASVGKEGKAGYVYAVSNPAMPGLLKIGRTQRDPDERLKEFNARTEVAMPFRIEAVIATRNAAWTERAVHERLAGSRVNERREFFRTDPATALSTMQAVAREQRQKAYDRKDWKGRVPLFGGMLMSLAFAPVVMAIEPRLLTAWFCLCVFTMATSRIPTMKEFLSGSRDIGLRTLVPVTAAAVWWAVAGQNALAALPAFVRHIPL